MAADGTAGVEVHRELASKVQRQANSSRNPQASPERKPARRGTATEPEQWAGHERDHERLENKDSQEPAELNQSMRLQRKNTQRSYIDQKRL